MPNFSGKWTLAEQAQGAAAGTWTGISVSELYAWGENGAGELGLGDITRRLSPVQVGSSSWSDASAGESFSFAVDPTGKLFAAGINSQGQLGLGDTTSLSSFTQVGALTTWAKAVAGMVGSSSLAIKTDGTLWAWGYNNHGQLGLGNKTKFSSPVQVGADTNWSEIAIGNFAMAIKTDGTFYAWGYNNYNGALGLGDTINRSSPVQVGALTTWSKIAIGAAHCIALKTDGTLWAWGSSFNGQLGQGNTTYHSSPVQVGALTTWSKVAAAPSNASGAINTSGQLFTWGSNSNGQLGLGDTTQQNSPVQVGALTTWVKIEGGSDNFAAIKTDGTLWDWGSNTFGSLGLDDQVNRSSPVQVGALTTWSEIAISKHALAFIESTT